jgi:hypothetical protein
MCGTNVDGMEWWSVRADLILRGSGPVTPPSRLVLLTVFLTSFYGSWQLTSLSHVNPMGRKPQRLLVDRAHRRWKWPWFKANPRFPPHSGESGEQPRPTSRGYPKPQDRIVRTLGFAPVSSRYQVDRVDCSFFRSLISGWQACIDILDLTRQKLAILHRRRAQTRDGHRD